MVVLSMERSGIAAAVARRLMLLSLLSLAAAACESPKQWHCPALVHPGRFPNDEKACTRDRRLDGSA